MTLTLSNGVEHLKLLNRFTIYASDHIDNATIIGSFVDKAIEWEIVF